MCSEPAGVRSQLPACLGHSSVVSEFQRRFLMEHPPTPQIYLLVPVPVLLQKGKFVSQVIPVTSFKLSPRKTHPSTVERKGGSMGRQGQKYIKEWGYETGIPEAIVTAQAPSITALCYWQDLGKDLQFCSLFLANQSKRLAFSYWSRGLHSPGGHRVVSLFINTFVLSQFCLRHQCDVSITPA